jgi:hypothetical protein
MLHSHTQSRTPLFSIAIRVLAAGVLVGTAIPARAASIMVDDFSGNRLGTRTVNLLPAAGTSTTAPGTFTESGGYATMTFGGDGNGQGGVRLTYNFSATDLTSGNTNEQFFLAFASIERSNAQAWETAMNASITVTDSHGTSGTYSTGIASASPFNMVFNFTCSGGGVCFSPNPDWTSITRIVVLLQFPSNYTSGSTTTAILNEIRATPLGGTPPAPPVPGITAAANPDCSAPIGFTVTFTSAGTPVTVTGFSAAGVNVSGSAPGTLSAAVSGSGSTYTVNVSGMTGPGTVGIQIPLSAAADNWGQGNIASSTVTTTYGSTPTITSAASSNFTEGVAGSFTVTASGFPAPAITRSSGTLPTGLTWSSPTISGTPAVGTGGSYSLVFRASNGCGFVAQNYTLQVNVPPAITSAASTTFATGTPGSFSVTATGVPTPSLSVSGSRPSGITFTDNGDGTATLAGTPAAGTGGNYPLTITAANGILPNATQSFTLTVNQSPAITSAASATFTVGSAGSLTVTTSGFPTPALTVSGSRPSGITFTDNGDGTATLAGTPAAGTGGNYPLTITAANGILSNATQSFTLTVNQPPAITSAASAAFTTGTAGSFSVTTTGFPTPALSASGSRPSGVTFTDNGDGTATLAGTPAAGTDGSYPLTFTAANGILPNATQSFTLTVHQGPAITSAASTTFTTGTAGSFSVTTTGFPAPTLSVSGTRPSGITFTDNGDGTATLAGTPAAGTGGSYPLTFTAANGTLPNATQSFTLTVNQPPAITSAASATFTVDSAGSFTVTTSGSPVPGLTVSGSRPSGITFTDNGDGTATLAGTPAVGTGGSYPLTFTAANGILPNATQSFTLTIGNVTMFSGPTATGTGTATATFSGGGPACTFASAAFVAAPAGTTLHFPHGLFQFTLEGCSEPVVMSITYPTELPQGTAYWKHGPEPADASAHWYMFQDPISTPTSVFELTLNDGERGDDDLEANGTIVDQGGPGQQADAIPTLGGWPLALLAVLLALSGAIFVRRLRG